MSPTLPKTQTVSIVEELGSPMKLRHDFPVPTQAELASGECLVKLHCTGVCHSDLHLALGDWPIVTQTPIICGHEGVGIIVAIGSNTPDSPVKLGDRVGIKFLAYSCLNCEQCLKGREQFCSRAKYSGFSINGTFAQYVVSYVNHVTLIPEGYDSNAAASILCAGLTVYRAIKYSETNPGDFIVIPGAGGGLGHLAIQYAKVRGLRVIAIDTGAEKKKMCLELGAENWIDFKESKDIVQDVKAITGGLGAHSALITATESSGYSQALEYLRSGSTLMAVGLPGNGAKLSAEIFPTVFRGMSILGSCVGNRQDAREALDIAARGEVKVHFAVKKMPELQSVYDGMMAGTIAGRVVVDMTIE